MLSSLILTAFLMGLGGAPHCAAMCGAACASLLPRGVPLASLLGRSVGYAILGAIASSSFGLVAQWGRRVAFLQPLWILALAFSLALGLWLIWRGTMPGQIDELGQGLYRALRRRLSRTSALSEQGALRSLAPFVAGMAWALLPCGLLYAALMVAALAPHAWAGAAIMLAFSLPSASGVWGAPFLLGQLARLQAMRRAASGQALVQSAVPLNGAAPTVAPVLWLKSAHEPSGGQACQRSSLNDGAFIDLSDGVFDPRWAVRLSGLMLAGMSAWALAHQVMEQWRAWCA